MSRNKIEDVVFSGDHEVEAGEADKGVSRM